MKTVPCPMNLCNAESTSFVELLYTQQQPLVQKLLQHYGRSPELLRDLRGQVYSLFTQLVVDYGPKNELPIDVFIARTLPSQISDYIQTYWDDAQAGASAAGGLRHAEQFERDLPLLRLPVRVLRDLPTYVGRLPHRQRVVLVWSYLEGRSDAEIADHLGITPIQVDELRHQAIRSIHYLSSPELSG